MPNLSALAPFTTAATALSNLVLVTPQSVQGYQPQNKPNDDGTMSTAAQPESFLFHYEGEQSVALESDITDHYVEDNTAVADQIALKPEIISTHGFIGELNDVVPALLKPLKIAADKLTTIGAYVPALSVTALLAYSEAFLLYQVAANAANSAVAAWSSITNAFSDGSQAEIVEGSGVFAGTGVQNRQQVAFQQLYGYWRTRTLFTVQTPWAIFQNMAIKSLRAVQDAETRVITDFEISFKIIRQASTLSTLTDGISNTPQSFQTHAGAQASDVQNLGTSSGVPGFSFGDNLATMVG